MKESKAYKTMCSSYDVLLMESGLKPAPTEENWWTFEPEEGDLAKAGEATYEFKSGKWEEVGE